MSTTLLVLMQEICKDGFGYVGITPSSAGTTTTVIANAAASELDPDDENTLFGSAWLMCISDSADTPLNVGETRRIDKDSGTGYVASTGTLAVTRAYTNATTTTQRFGLFMGLPPEDYGLARGLKTYVNEVLRQLRYRHYHLLTLITDGDMETSGTTNWTASNTTLSKVATAAYVIGGGYSLRALNSVASGYAQSASVPVVEGQTYECAADVRVSSGTAILRLWDVTNGASIDTSTTTELRKGFLYLDNALIPSGCKQVAVRLEGTEADADIYWDTVTLRNRQAREMALPSWFVKPEWLEEVVYTGGGNQEQDNDSYNVDEQSLEFLHYRRVIVDHTASTPYRVEFSRPPSGCHLFARCHRPYAELTSITDSTTADKDWVKAWALERIFADKKGKDEDAKRARAKALELHKTFAPKWQGRPFVPHRDI